MANMDTDGFPGTEIKTKMSPADTIMRMQRLIDNEWSRKAKANEEIIDAMKQLFREKKKFTAGAVRDMLECDYPWLIEESDALQLARHLMSAATLEFFEENK